MTDKQQPEELRPIPDGGLKDSMPGWLKRPPAWRNMPTAEQRHERSLPETDTSEINPANLVDVSDLPQWLQTIAARGEVPIPEPDQAVGHALEQIQAVSARANETRLVDEPEIHKSAADMLSATEEPGKQEPAAPTVESGSQQNAESKAQASSIFTPLTLGILVIALVVVGLAVYFLM